MSNTTAKNDGVNRAKLYQLALFPLNNGATNVYFVLILNFVAQFGSNILQLGLYASVMVTVMRVFDAITDPIIGAMMDKTSTRFGKFRPFMVLGSAIMAVSILALYCLTPLIPETTMWLRYVAFTLIYAVWVIGYTFQTSVTRAGQTVLTNDPNQRPLFTIFNTIGSMLGMGVMQFLIPIVKGMYDVKVDGKIVTDGFAVPEMWAVIAPIGIVLSVLLTILAIFGIAAKDRPEYYGIGGGTQKKVKISEYISIIKANKPMQRLMVAGAGCKLALAIATNATVLTVLYGVMMGDYSGLYLPFMVLGYVFAVPFFILSVRTSQKFGQKASLERYVRVARAGAADSLRRSDGTLGAAGQPGFLDRHQRRQYPLLPRVRHLLRRGIRRVLRYGRHADSDGRGLLRLRDVPLRQVHPRYHGDAVLAGR